MDQANELPSTGQLQADMRAEIDGLRAENGQLKVEFSKPFLAESDLIEFYKGQMAEHTKNAIASRKRAEAAEAIAEAIYAEHSHCYGALHEANIRSDTFLHNHLRQEADLATLRARCEELERSRYETVQKLVAGSNSMSEELNKTRDQLAAAQAGAKFLSEALDEGIKDREYFNKLVKAQYVQGLERAQEIADAHQCGGDDDIVCQHQNCVACIFGGIQAEIDKAKEGA